MNREFIKSLGFAINKCIRHSEYLQVSNTGWCYLTDIACILWAYPGKYYHRFTSRHPTDEEMMCAMEMTKVGRFHVSAVNKNDRGLLHNLMVRPAQGYSGRLGGLVDDALCYASAMHVGNLCHYTKMGFLDTIIGLRAQGLVPGGILGRGQRTHIYCVPHPPPLNGLLPNSFQRRNTDCVLLLDVDAMKKDFALYQTTNDTVLISKPVPASYVLRVIMLGVTRYTLWHQPTEYRMRTVAQARCKCNMCFVGYASGTSFCYRGCWLPLTRLAVHERLMHIERKIDRDGELRVMYGMTISDLQAELKKPGSSIRSLPPKSFTATCYQRSLVEVYMAPAGSGEQSAKRSRITKAKASAPQPAMAAQRVVSAPAGPPMRGSVAAASSSGTRTPTVLTPRQGSGQGTVSAPAELILEGSTEEARRNRAALCVNLTDGKMHDLNKNARKQKDADGVNKGFRSHIDRYRADLAYRQNMQRQNVPEWFVFHTTGHTYRADGAEGDQWPRR